MKNALVFIVLGMFCISFAFAANGNGIPQQAQVQTENTGEDEVIQTQTTSQARTLTQTQIQEVIREKNKLKIQAQISECPESCTCTGSATKCQINGGREMTIMAGKSGNTIVQVKNANMSTKVVLYKSEGKVYGVFRDNQTRNINILPDQVKEKVQAKIKANVEGEVIELDEDGVYQVQAKKRAKLFGFIPVREKVRMEVNSETGEVTRIRNSWWGFLAKDEVEELVEDVEQ